MTQLTNAFLSDGWDIDFQLNQLAYGDILRSGLVFEDLVVLLLEAMVTPSLAERIYAAIERHYEPLDIGDSRCHNLFVAALFFPQSRYYKQATGASKDSFGLIDFTKMLMPVHIDWIIMLTGEPQIKFMVNMIYRHYQEHILQEYTHQAELKILKYSVIKQAIARAFIKQLQAKLNEAKTHTMTQRVHSPLSPLGVQQLLRGENSPGFFAGTSGVTDFTPPDMCDGLYDVSPLAIPPEWINEQLTDHYHITGDGSCCPRAFSLGLVDILLCENNSVYHQARAKSGKYSTFLRGLAALDICENNFDVFIQYCKQNQQFSQKLQDKLHPVIRALCCYLLQSKKHQGVIPQEPSLANLNQYPFLTNLVGEYELFYSTNGNTKGDIFSRVPKIVEKFKTLLDKPIEQAKQILMDWFCVAQEGDVLGFDVFTNHIIKDNQWIGDYELTLLAQYFDVTLICEAHGARSILYSPLKIPQENFHELSEICQKELFDREIINRTAVNGYYHIMHEDWRSRLDALGEQDVLTLLTSRLKKAIVQATCPAYFHVEIDDEDIINALLPRGYIALSPEFDGAFYFTVDEEKCRQACQESDLCEDKIKAAARYHADFRKQKFTFIWPPQLGVQYQQQLIRLNAIVCMDNNIFRFNIHTLEAWQRRISAVRERDSILQQHFQDYQLQETNAMLLANLGGHWVTKKLPHSILGTGVYDSGDEYSCPIPS